MFPRRKKIYKPLTADGGIQSFDKFGNLRRYTPIAFAGLAISAKVTTERNERGGTYINGVCAESDRFYNVRAAPYRTARND